MSRKFEMPSKWAYHEMKVERIDGFLQFSISDFVKRSKDAVSKNGKILDLGCGSGRHSFYFKRQGFDSYASDIDCNKIRNNCMRLGITNIHIREHSFTEIPYPDQFFDAVFCMSTLHHAIINDILKGANEVFRVLKQGGIFVFDFLSCYDNSFGVGEEIEKNTFIGSRDGEEDIPHHYANEGEIEILTKKFSDMQMSKSIYHCKFENKQFTSKTFDVIAVK